MNTLRKSIALLTLQERRRGILVCLLVIVTALFEVVGVSSIVPFLSVLANPEMVQNNAMLAAVFDYFGFSSTYGFLLFLGVLAFCLLLTAAMVRSLGQYALVSFTQMQRHSIGARLLETYLRQPYEYYINRHTSDLSKSILSEVDQVIIGVFTPISLMIAQGVTLLAIVTLLIVIDPWVALIAGGVLAGVYCLIFTFIRAYLVRTGALRVEANRKRFEATSEAFGGIKDIKLLGREYTYLTRFIGPSLQMSRLIAVSLVLAQLPKYIVEAIAFGGILLLSLLLLVQNGGHDAEALGQVLPLLGLYAFAGYRMIPAVQAVYTSMTQLRFGGAAVDSLYEDLCGKDHLPPLERTVAAALPLTQQIAIESLTYSYPNAEVVGLRDVTVTIPVGSTLGIVGSTGAGKTTLVDLVLGLLTPSSGGIRVDGVLVTEQNRRMWQANIGYVPQDIFLVDASLSANIAMGIPEEDVNYLRIRECARQAQIDRFIEEELPLGYDTQVGERGVRLSGGQRQRIGIARALYHDPAIIVFDEATSALDNLTEQDVMRAVGALQGRKTIIMIAHRISTVKNCDQIVVLEKGRVVGHGTFDALTASNKAFRRISGVTETT